MRIDNTDGVLIEGVREELESLRDDIDFALETGGEAKSSMINPEGATWFIVRCVSGSSRPATMSDQEKDRNLMPFTRQQAEIYRPAFDDLLSSESSDPECTCTYAPMEGSGTYRIPDPDCPAHKGDTDED